MERGTSVGVSITHGNKILISASEEEDQKLLIYFSEQLVEIKNKHVPHRGTIFFSKKDDTKSESSDPSDSKPGRSGPG